MAGGAVVDDEQWRWCRQEVLQAAKPSGSIIYLS